jgi:hypothetical protein
MVIALYLMDVVDARFLFDKAAVFGDMLKEWSCVISWALSCSQVQWGPSLVVCCQFQVLHCGLFGHLCTFC